MNSLITWLNYNSRPALSQNDVYFKTFCPRSDAIKTSNCVAYNLEVIILSPEMRKNYSTNYEKMASKTQLMYSRAWLCPYPLEELTTRTESAFWKTVIKCCMGILYTWVTDLQILGCGLHLNASSGRAPPGPAVEAMKWEREGRRREGERGDWRGEDWSE